MKFLPYLIPFTAAAALMALALPLAALTALPLGHHHLVLAQAGVGPATDVDPTVLVQQVLQLISNWKTGGVALGLIAISNLTSNLLKLKWVQDRITVRPWALPLASGVVAALGAFGTSLHAAPVLDLHAVVAALGAAVISALTIGLGGVGLHEAVNLFNVNKQAERAAGAVLHDALVKGDAQAIDKLNGMTELKAIAGLPTDVERAKALQAWAQVHPPEAVAQVAP